MHSEQFNRTRKLVCKRVAAQLKLDFEEVCSVAAGERKSETIERALDEAIDEVAERILRELAPTKKEPLSGATSKNGNKNPSKTHTG